jgi:hypothetical protein
VKDTISPSRGLGSTSDAVGTHHASAAIRINTPFCISSSFLLVKDEGDHFIMALNEGT